MKRPRWIVPAGAGVAFLAALLSAWALTQRRNANADLPTEPVAALVVTSPSFANGGQIPTRFSCDGRNISPPLSITGAAGATKSIVIIMNDLDAPLGFIHWVAFDVPPDVRDVPEGARLGIQGKNDFDSTGYGGPCPPTGRHRYQFRVYALDSRLGLAAGATKREITTAARGHVLAEGKIIGVYR